MTAVSFTKIPDPETLFKSCMMSSTLCYGKSHLQVDLFFDQTAFDHQLTNCYWTRHLSMPQTTHHLHDARRTWIYMIMVGCKKLNWPLRDTLMVVETFHFPCPAPQADYENHLQAYQLLLSTSFEELTTPAMLSLPAPIFNVPQIRPAGAGTKVTVSLMGPWNPPKLAPSAFSSIYAHLVDQVRFPTPIYMALVAESVVAAKPKEDVMDIEPTTATLVAFTFLSTDHFKSIDFDAMTPQKRTNFFKVFGQDHVVFNGHEVKKVADKYPRSKVAKALSTKAQKLINSPFDENNAIYEMVIDN